MNFFLNWHKIKTERPTRAMATYEEELKKLEPLIQRVSSFALLGKKIEVEGEENFIKNGPNIIVGNHIGSYKDGATLFKVVKRPFFFTANKMIYSRKEFNFLIRRHLKRHLKRFGLFLDVLLNPLKSLFVQVVSTNIAKVGTIPVDLYDGKRLAIERCQEYLKKGRAIIALQGRGRVKKKESHPYVTSFKRGSSIIAYNLYKNDGISVPVTPLAFFGTHIPFMIPAKIRINVGYPMYIRDYMREEEEEEMAIEKFRKALEERVKSLFLEIIKK